MAECFNWATSSQKWIAKKTNIGLGLRRCFNWATSSQKWIDEGVNLHHPAGTEFQLGHFFAEMDSSVRTPDTAGLEPFQLGHFFAEMDSSQRRNRNKDRSMGFNWATSSQKWIDGNSQNIEVNNYYVSIGPLLRRNG